VLVLLVIVGAAAAAAKGAGRNVITHIKGFEGPLPFHLETG
jgi:serine carboxypeptidase-like clade 1